jgi:hypothetical protein
MRMFFAVAAVALAVAGYSTTTFAQGDDARCVAIINETQHRIGNSRDADRGAIQRELDAAYSALKQGGDRRACLAHAQRAADMARGAGSGSSRAPDRSYDRRYDDRRDSGGIGDLIERSLGGRGR